MPIRPEMKALYPPDWKDIRERILDRDGHKCKLCGAPNREWIARSKADAKTWEQLGPTEYGGNGRGIEEWGPGEHYDPGVWRKPVRVVLTIAHLNDPNPANCADDNLAALCQLCHLLHDRELHAKTRAETRAKKERET